MGLDYSIEARFHREHDNKVEEFEVEIAYWRKCWTLRTETMNIAERDPSKVIEMTDDFLLRTKLDTLSTVMNALLDECKDRDSEWFADSIWGSSIGRQITLRQLKRIAAWDSLFSSLDRIAECESIEARQDLINHELDWIIEEIEQDSDFNMEHEKFIEILTHFEDWEISLCYHNSY